ncbi:MAG: hypothetical protein D8B59_00720, partial [Bacteroidetes bacterium]
IEIYTIRGVGGFPTLCGDFPTSVGLFPTSVDLFPTSVDLLPTSVDLLPTSVDLFPTDKKFKKTVLGLHIKIFSYLCRSINNNN